MDWGGANSRFLGLVSVWAARSFDQTALRPSVIKRIRQIDVKHISQASVSLREHVWVREHACVSSRGAQSTELVSLYIGYWTLNNYYYYYYRSVREDIASGEKDGRVIDPSVGVQVEF